jgi:transcription termination factor Rho
MNASELESKTRDELLELAKQQGVEGRKGMKKSELIQRLSQVFNEQQGYIMLNGILDIMDDGYGFLRQESLLPGADDVYISHSQIRRFGLRNGDCIRGQARPPKDSEKYYSLLRVESVNDIDPEQSRNRRNFSSLTPTFPDKMFDLETDYRNLSTRLINLVSPIRQKRAKQSF